jgi:D-methionine transport system substrate-binding protein
MQRRKIKKIKLAELDAAQLPRALDDLDAASINTDYAVKAGLQPTKDAIAIEDLKGPYANLIAVRAQDRQAVGEEAGCRL